MMNPGSPESNPPSGDLTGDVQADLAVNQVPSITDRLIPDSIDVHPIPGIHVSDSADQSIDPSLDEDPLADRVALGGFRATRTGDRALGLIHVLLVNRCLLPTAFSQFGQAPLPRRLRKLFRKLQADVEVASITQILQKHERIFGSVAVQMILMGEPLCGIAGSIQRYLKLREDIRNSGGMFARRIFCRRTRVFAATLGASFEISMDFPAAIRCAAVELPKRYHAGIRRLLRRVGAGRRIREAMPIRGLFVPGFERGFVYLAELAVESSSVPAIMQHCLKM